MPVATYGWEVGVAEQKSTQPARGSWFVRGGGRRACPERSRRKRSTGLAACTLRGQARMPALPEYLSLPDAVAVCTFTRNALGGGEWGTNRYFYQTKPTGLLESTKGSGKRVKKPPKSQPKPLIEGLYNGFSSGLPAGVNQEWQATGNAVMLSKAGAQALPACTLRGQARMPVATYGLEIYVAEQKINQSCSAELVCG